MAFGDLGVLMVHARNTVYRLEPELALIQHLAIVGSTVLVNPKSYNPVSQEAVEVILVMVKITNDNSIFFNCYLSPSSVFLMK